METALVKTVKTPDFVNMLLRERGGLPAEWKWYMFDANPPKSAPEGKAIFKGSVPGVYVKGRRKGQDNWEKRDRTWDRTFYLDEHEIAHFKQEWEKRTGLCHRCGGDGVMSCGWSSVTGELLQTCNRCGGTGKRAAVPRPEAVGAG